MSAYDALGRHAHAPRRPLTTGAASSSGEPTPNAGSPGPSVRGAAACRTESLWDCADAAVGCVEGRRSSSGLALGRSHSGLASGGLPGDIGH
jgi:hypothetical protein